jgi:hypothetical protein
MEVIPRPFIRREEGTAASQLFATLEKPQWRNRRVNDEQRAMVTSLRAEGVPTRPSDTLSQKLALVKQRARGRAGGGLVEQMERCGYMWIYVDICYAHICRYM